MMKASVININNFSTLKFDTAAYFEQHKSIHFGSIIECEGKRLVVLSIAVNKDGSLIIEAS